MDVCSLYADETIQNIDVDSLGLRHGEADKFRELYAGKQVMDDAESFVGDWKRTNVSGAVEFPVFE